MAADKPLARAEHKPDQRRRILHRYICAEAPEECIWNSGWMHKRRAAHRAWRAHMRATHSIEVNGEE